LAGYRHLRTDYLEGRIVHHVERVEHKRACKECGASWQRLTLDGRFERTFLGLPVGRKRQEVVLHGHLQLCSACGKRSREPIPFATGSNRYLRAAGRYMVMLCGITQIKYVARLLGVGWDLVKDAFKADLERRHKRRPLRKIRYIAVDEFATHKGHKYMTSTYRARCALLLTAFAEVEPRCWTWRAARSCTPRRGRTPQPWRGS
jgi:transposase